MERKPAVVAKKGYKDGIVGLAISLRCHGYGDGARIDGSTDLSIQQARELAAALISHADAAEAAIAKKAAQEDRRQKWRDREVAAGRMQIISFGGRP